MAELPSKGRLSFLSKNVGPKPFKIWMVLVIIVVLTGSIGGYVMLKPLSLLNTGQVSSVLNGNWNQSKIQEMNSTQAINMGWTGADWIEISYYHSGNRNLSVLVVKFINSNYAESQFSSYGFIMFSNMNQSSGSFKNAPYVYGYLPPYNSVFGNFSGASGIATQHSKYVIFMITKNFGMSLQQSENLLSDQISDL